MKSNPSSTSRLALDSPLESLSPSKTPSPSLGALKEAGVQTISDLLWVLPLRAIPTPKLRSFSFAREGEIFLGQGKIIHAEIKPAFGRRTKGRFLLHNGHLVVKSLENDQTLSLRFFNLYPQQKKSLEAMDKIWFLGTLQNWRGQAQIINPKIYPITDVDWRDTLGEWLVEYPTINKIPGNFTSKLMQKIPPSFWDEVHSPWGVDELNPMKLGTALRIMHGRISPDLSTKEAQQEAEERLAYEEFFLDQLKILTRRRFIKKKISPSLPGDLSEMDAWLKLVPFKLTEDQESSIKQILGDMNTGHPMMRMLQGDVGCGKTIVAMLVALFVIKSGKQVALMCPTEALALQHMRTVQSFFSSVPFLKPALLLGSLKKKAKTELQAQMKNGDVNFVIGTHGLFQESVEFRDLALAIIDEQHKFGVEQRLMLTAKGQGTHCLIMSATPIPRTLALAQYGDLDFTTIKTMPSGRKGIKTRIVEPPNYPKYLQFMKERLAQGEQGYFVFPAIEESEKIDLQNVTEAFEKYQKLLPEARLAVLHGKMKSEEKEATIVAFTEKKIDILIATSLIEVGINVPDATFMCIYQPERFGLSSLHQLRGRTGRGEKTGFCFLVTAQELGPEALERLQVLEKTTDGFVIAEADLQNRGEGDLFGVDQSGVITSRRVADFQRHAHVLEKVYRDIQQIMAKDPKIFEPLMLKLARDQKILDTI